MARGVGRCVCVCVWACNPLGLAPVDKLGMAFNESNSARGRGWPVCDHYCFCPFFGATRALSQLTILS